MTNVTKLSLFLFPPGARGDFLMSILYGNVLEETWDKAMINNVGTHGNTDKSHGINVPTEFNKIMLTPDSLNRWNSYYIKINNCQDEWTVGWLNYHKHPEEGEFAWKIMYGRYCLTQRLNKTFAEYQNQYNHVINFEDLWKIEYIQEIYQKVHNDKLRNNQLSRIQHNIDINLELISKNPFDQMAVDQLVATTNW